MSTKKPSRPSSAPLQRSASSTDVAKKIALLKKKSQRPQSAKGKRSTPPMSDDTLKRLSTPVKKELHLKNVSANMDDCKNCTFSPKISENAKQHAQGMPKFLDRLTGYTAKFKDNAKVEPKLAFTFSPKLNTEKFAEKLSERGSFLERMEDDHKSRQDKITEKRNLNFTFQPDISNRRTSRISISFLDRLQQDLATREENARHRQQESQVVPYAFKPNIEKSQKRNPASGEFLDRMQADVGNRREKEDRRSQLFGLALNQFHPREIREIMAGQQPHLKRSRSASLG